MTVSVLILVVAACGSPTSRVSSASVVQSTKAAVGSGNQTSPARGRGPFTLVTLANLGSLSWRCADSDRSRRYALGFVADAQAATETVSYVAGGRTSASVVQPGAGIVFPFGGQEPRMLEIVQPTEPGTIRAVIRVSFGPVGHCATYEPPGLDVHESWVTNAAP